MSHPLTTTNKHHHGSNPSHLGDEEFALSNSEFMTEEDARSRGMSKSPLVIQSKKLPAQSSLDGGDLV